MNLILFILVLGVNILIHEFAHFYFARKADILCHEFAIGMGPVVYSKKKGETLYSIRAIPLGGYVSMAGEEMADYINVDQNIGIKLNEDGKVDKIVLNNDSEYDFLGKVIDFDLYGADNKPLFIKLLISGEEKEFEVCRDAYYILSEKKKLQVGPAERSFETKTLWQRFSVVIAGPVSNFLLAFFILFFLAFFIGKPVKEAIVGETSSRLEGIIETNDTIKTINGEEVLSFKDIGNHLSKVTKDSVEVTINDSDEILIIDLAVILQGLGFTNVDETGNLIKEEDGRVKVGQVSGSSDLKPNDIITGIFYGESEKLNNIPYVDINNWEELIQTASANKEAKHVYLKVLRLKDSESNEFEEVTMDYNNLKASTLEKLGSEYIIYQIGIGQQSKFNILYPLYFPFIQIGNDMKSMFNTIALLFSTKSGVGVKDLAGPVGIFQLVSNARKNGAASFMIFVAFLSVNIGFLNLLPIPALDGGRLVFIGYEAITKRKVNKKVENALIFVTFVLLMTLMVVVTYQDILRLFRR